MRSAIAAILIAACGHDDSSIVRGRGIPVANLSAADIARVYEAAARGSFDLDDPGMSLLLDPRQLPQTVGLSPSGRVNESVISELKLRGAVKGTCEPPLSGATGNARCEAALPGYVVRFSPVFALAPDSTQVYVYAQKYDLPGQTFSSTLRFERAYQVVRHDGVWRAAREGRVPKELRGEPK